MINGKCSSLLFLHYIIKEGSLDSNATAFELSPRLMNLPDVMIKCEHDISKFNGVIYHDVIESLNTCGDKFADDDATMLLFLFLG